MVHAQLLKENPGLTYKQVRSLERMDAKKAREEKELEIGHEAVKQAGGTAQALLEAGAAFAAGPGGYVLAWLGINLAQQVKITDNQNSDWLVVQNESGHIEQVFSGFGGKDAADLLAAQKNLEPPQPIFGSQVGTGPANEIQKELNLIYGTSTAPLAVQTRKFTYSVKERKHYTFLLDSTGAGALQILLGTAAASGVAGSLLGGLFKAKP